SFVVWVRVKLFSSLVIVTCAPDTARPCKSVIVPRSDEVPVWAKATLDISSVKASTLKMTRALFKAGLAVFMESSIGDLCNLRKFFDTHDPCGCSRESVA